MHDNCPSITALRVALRRAAHQVLDAPRIFDDPLALRILGLDKEAGQGRDQSWLAESLMSRVLRVSLAVRSRYAEDTLHASVDQGVDQYVVLGAGLDTFACRNPYSGETLQIIEVDHPVMQTWKRGRLADAGLTVPENCIFAPLDVETMTLADGLLAAGFDSGRRAFFSWLGVSMYLTGSAIVDTLRFVAALPAGSGIVFDYMLMPSLLSPEARVAFDGLSRHVARAGEPFQSFFDPLRLASDLRGMGFTVIEDSGPEEMDARYCQGRTDQLRVGKLAHLMHAQV